MLQLLGSCGASWQQKTSAQPTLTWQSVDKPCELLFGDVGPAEVKADRLSSDDTTQCLGGDGLAPAQIYLCPQSFVTAPGGRGQG